jgi:putative SOS response-associated peptidase YedK
MCSRYSLTSPAEAVRNYFRCQRGHEFPPRYNIAPTQPVSVVRTGADNERELVLVRWGLVPAWVKQPAEFTTILNARAETVLDKPSFKAAMRHRRCIVPADAFYEWVGPAGAKRPFMIRRAELAPGAGSLLGLAGLWEHWMGADGSEIETMAILTVPANAAVLTIHDRMPAILPDRDFDAWLDVKAVRDREAWTLLQPAPDDLLSLVELEPAINSSRVEGAGLQTPRMTGTARKPAPGPHGTLL